MSMNEFKMKKYRTDSKVLERYPLGKIASNKSAQFENIKSSTIEINCRPSSRVGLIEHVIEEAELGECIPTSLVIEDNSPGIEIVPDFNADREESTFRDNETTSKWSPSDTFTFLEAIKVVLTEEEISGGYLSRKSIFEKVTELLKDNGFTVSANDAEKKYNNMLMTYRRCQKRLMQKKQAPLWPYFKLFEEIRNKDIELNNIPSEAISKKRKLTDKPEPQILMRKADEYSTEEPQSTTQDTSGWKAKRSELNHRKRILLQRLLLSAKNGRQKDANLRLSLKETDEIEIEYLKAIKVEVQKTSTVLMGGLKNLKTSLGELKNILLNK